jgi:LPXTG-motif cell wall-anchored protein
MEIIYYTKDVTINDTNNSNEFVRVYLDAVYAEGELAFNRAPLAAYKDGIPIEPKQCMQLDKTAGYTFLLADGYTRAEAALLPDNRLDVKLTGKVITNFAGYTAPVLESQGEKELIVDEHGNRFEQTAAYQMKTMDGMTYFMAESRTYKRADAFSPVVRIELNTADGIMRGIVNKMRPGNHGNPESPEKPKEKVKVPEVEKPDEETKKMSEDNIPLIDKEDTSLIEEGDIPKTGAESNYLWMLLAFASLAVLGIFSRKRVNR